MAAWLDVGLAVGLAPGLVAAAAKIIVSTVVIKAA